MVNLWPFEKSFSDIPCAREASIGGILGGIGAGAISIIITNQYKYAFKTSTYGGFVTFWITFLGCRYQVARQEKLTRQFVDSLDKGEID